MRNNLTRKERETQLLKDTLEELKERFPRAFHNNKVWHSNAVAEFLLELKGEEPISSNLKRTIAFYQSGEWYLSRVIEKKWYRDVYGSKVCLIPEEDKIKAAAKLDNIYKRLRADFLSKETNFVTLKDNQDFAESQYSRLDFDELQKIIVVLSFNTKGIFIWIKDTNLYFYRDGGIADWLTAKIYKASDYGRYEKVLVPEHVYLCVRRMHFNEVDNAETYLAFIKEVDAEVYGLLREEVNDDED